MIEEDEKLESSNAFLKKTYSKEPVNLVNFYVALTTTSKIHTFMLIHTSKIHTQNMMKKNPNTIKSIIKTEAVFIVLA